MTPAAAGGVGGLGLRAFVFLIQDPGFTEGVVTASGNTGFTFLEALRRVAAPLIVEGWVLQKKNKRQIQRFNLLFEGNRCVILPLYNKGKKDIQKQ